MTEAVYLEDSTRRSIDATVERVLDGTGDATGRVVLDRTICYPEGGGQPADRGTIRADGGTWAIVDVRKRDAIYHHLQPADGTDAADAGDDTADVPEEGADVTVDLDWDRRDGHMRHHTAQHLLSRVLVEDHAAPTRGNQVYDDRARIDCEHDRFGDDDLAAIESRVNELIEDDRPVTWYTLDRETAEERLDPERTRIDLLPDSIEELRIVEVEGFDRTACAGTHVASTGECGAFELAGRESAGGDVERLRFQLG